jgi:hypothetical protein
MSRFRIARAGALLLSLTLVAGACEKTRTITAVDTAYITLRGDTVFVNTRDTVRFGQDRVFNQVERLGAPLVAEVFLEKRDHDFHDAGTPSTDRVNFKSRLVKFITTVAGRDAAYANTVADALLPDMIVVQTDKAPTTAGYLQHALTNGYGGRKLADDVVDLSLMVVFGNALGNNNNVSPGLVSDNVPSDSPFRTVFPYLAPAN